MLTKHKQSGFTIVELLIVIIVVGILATTTIVAYSGVQNRARVSALTSDLVSTYKKLQVFQIDNSAYPADLATVGIGASGGTSFQYTPNNTASPQNYCVTGTNGGISYKVSGSNSIPTIGGCAGHGQGGVEAVTNLVLNPNTNGLTGWAASGAVGSGTYVAGFDGATRAYRATRTATGAAVIRGTLAPISSSSPYSIIVSLRSDTAVNVIVQIRGTVSSLDSSAFVTVSLQPNLVQTVRTQGTSWSGSHTSPNIALAWNAGSIGNYVEVTKAFVTTGSSYTGNYADGSSTDWIWNGADNNATSTGPPQ